MPCALCLYPFEILWPIGCCFTFLAVLNKCSGGGTLGGAGPGGAELIHLPSLSCSAMSSLFFTSSFSYLCFQNWACLRAWLLDSLSWMINCTAFLSCTRTCLSSNNWGIVGRLAPWSIATNLVWALKAAATMLVSYVTILPLKFAFFMNSFLDFIGVLSQALILFLAMMLVVQISGSPELKWLRNTNMHVYTQSNASM